MGGGGVPSAPGNPRALGSQLAPQRLVCRFHRKSVEEPGKAGAFCIVRPRIARRSAVSGGPTLYAAFSCTFDAPRDPLVVTPGRCARGGIRGLPGGATRAALKTGSRRGRSVCQVAHCANCRIPTVAEPSGRIAQSANWNPLPVRAERRRPGIAVEADDSSTCRASTAEPAGRP